MLLKRLQTIICLHSVAAFCQTGVVNSDHLWSNLAISICFMWFIKELNRLFLSLLLLQAIRLRKTKKHWSPVLYIIIFIYQHLNVTTWLTKYFFTFPQKKLAKKYSKAPLALLLEQERWLQIQFTAMPLVDKLKTGKATMFSTHLHFARNITMIHGTIC